MINLGIIELEIIIICFLAVITILFIFFLCKIISFLNSLFKIDLEMKKNYRDYMVEKISLEIQKNNQNKNEK